MSGTPDNLSDELRLYADPGEADAIDAIGERLREERPIPAAGFRAELRARLVALGSAPEPWRPRHLRLTVAAYLASGLLLLGIAALGVSGAGPFAA